MQNLAVYILFHCRIYLHVSGLKHKVHINNIDAVQTYKLEISI
jgi:hypothetical protein